MEFGADPKTLNKIGGNLLGYSEEYSRISKSMKEIATSMGEAYVSADNQAYVERIESFCNELDTMATALGNAGTRLQTGGEAYAGTEAELTDEARKLPGQG